MHNLSLMFAIQQFRAMVLRFDIVKNVAESVVQCSHTQALRSCN